LSVVDFPNKFEPQRAQGGQICFVLCREVQVCDQLLRQALMAELGEDVRLTYEGGPAYLVSFSDGQQAFFSHIAAPVPEQEAENNVMNNADWPDGSMPLTGYGSHIVVRLLSESEDAIALNILLTRLARVALQGFNGLGVYWGAGAVTHSREAFMRMTQNISSDSCFLDVWVRFQLLREGGDKISLYTVGLSQFGLNEIEVAPCAWSAYDLMKLVFNMARYLVQSGPVINDGDAVGGDENEGVVVRHAKGMHITDERVYRIMMQDL